MRQGSPGVKWTSRAPDADGVLRLALQNQFLVSQQDGVATVSIPDLGSIVNRVIAEPIRMETQRYGQRVNVIWLPAREFLTAEKSLDGIGPSARSLSVAGWRSTTG